MPDWQEQKLNSHKFILDPNKKFYRHSIQKLSEMKQRIDCLANWLTDWLTDWPTDRPTDRLTLWPNDRQTEWITEWQTDRLTDRSSIDQLNEWQTGWPTDWMSVWLIVSLSDRLSIWLTHTNVWIWVMTHCILSIIFVCLNVFYTTSHYRYVSKIWGA
jgi:hypothetical protein